MNFLIKIETAINELILKLIEKLKGLLPHFIFAIIPAIHHYIAHIKHKIHEKLPELKIMLFKAIGYIKHYLLIIQGHFTAFFIFLRSEEFKKNKFNYLKAPFKYCKEHPLASMGNISLVVFFFVCSFFVYKTSSKVFVETKKMRAPASSHVVEVINHNEFELHHKKFEVALKAAVGGHGGGGGHHEVEVVFDIKVEATTAHNKEMLEEMEEKLDVELEAFDFNISSVPISLLEIDANEKALITYLNHSFHHEAEGVAIKSIHLKQAAHKRPTYYLNTYHQYAMKDLSLQIFLEDTKRNRQINFDYTVLASNRNTVNYFTDNEFKVRDRLTSQVEPVIPQLPIEDEGRQIIKDKIRDELNDLLKEEKVEGKILEVYIDFIMAS